mmetsp:Transcript_119579/g.178654  ORF Transcript_119579/g.178654 Transcript_119579/m.178654 type:complete len:95 (+) Transcript_119579:378-662(+)
MNTFDVGFTASVELGNINEIDSKEYSENLKDSLIEAYTCFIHSLGTSEHADYFIDKFPKLFLFMEKALDSRLNPTVEFSRNCLVLVADIANYYK